MDIQNIVIDLFEQGVSENMLAVYCGCNQSTINRIKLGKIKNPSYALAMKIKKFQRSDRQR